MTFTESLTFYGLSVPGLIGLQHLCTDKPVYGLSKGGEILMPYCVCVFSFSYEGICWYFLKYKAGANALTAFNHLE